MSSRGLKILKAIKSKSKTICCKTFFKDNKSCIIFLITNFRPQGHFHRDWKKTLTSYTEILVGQDKEHKQQLFLFQQLGAKRPFNWRHFSQWIDKIWKPKRFLYVSNSDDLVSSLLNKWVKNGKHNLISPTSYLHNFFCLGNILADLVVVAGNAPCHSRLANIFVNSEAT